MCGIGTSSRATCERTTSSSTRARLTSCAAARHANPSPSAASTGGPRTSETCSRRLSGPFGTHSQEGSCLRTSKACFDRASRITTTTSSTNFASLTYHSALARTGSTTFLDLKDSIQAVTMPACATNVVYECLNAADFGVPQRRDRVLVVGIRADLGVEFRFPRGSHSQDALLYDQWVTGHYWDRHKIPTQGRPTLAPKRLRRRIERLSCYTFDGLGPPWRTVRDAINDLPTIGMGQSSRMALNHFLNPGARAYPGHDGSNWDEPAKTLKAGDHGVPGGENTLRMEDLSIRYLSVRECARLQTFPDNWFFEGSWTEAMRQLGNAVPVDLASTIASQVFRDLAATTAVPRRWVECHHVQRKRRATVRPHPTSSDPPNAGRDRSPAVEMSGRTR